MNEMRVRALERNYGVCFQYRQLCRRKWGESWSRKSEEDVVYLQKPKSPDIGDAIKFTQFCSLFDIMEIGYDNLSIPYWRSLKNTLLNTYRYYMELGHFKLIPVFRTDFQPPSEVQINRALFLCILTRTSHI